MRAFDGAMTPAKFLYVGSEFHQRLDIPWLRALYSVFSKKKKSFYWVSFRFFPLNWWFVLSFASIEKAPKKKKIKIILFLFLRFAFLAPSFRMRENSHPCTTVEFWEET